MSVFTVTEVKSVLNHGGPQLSGFNGYTMLCRDFVIPTTKGPVTQISLRYPSPIWWRPKLIRAVTPRQGGSYRVIYNHPQVVSYPGGGIEQWVDLQCPVALYSSGPVYAGAYFSGASAGTSGANTLATGRAECVGDPTSGVINMIDYSVNAQEDGWETPALGIRCQGETSSPKYFTHFNVSGLMDGWGTGATSSSISNSSFIGQVWDSDDNNHNDNVGVLTLVLYKEGFEHVFPGGLVGMPSGPVISSDFSSGLRLLFCAKGNNFSINQGKWRVWMQSRHPNDPTKYANFMCNIIDNSSILTDGQWHLFDQILSTNPDDWTYAGGHTDLYLPMPFDEALRNVSNFHLPIVRPVGSPRPTGEIHIDYVGLTYTAGN